MIIGVGGELESGKDTLSDFLCNEYGYTKMAFADNLKHACMEVFGLSHEQCYTTVGKKKEFEVPFQLTQNHIIKLSQWLTYNNKWDVHIQELFKMNDVVSKGITFDSPRVVLQFVGTELWRDCIDADIHAKMVKKEIDENSINKIVMCDCRFPNERIAVKKWEGELVLIKNPPVDCPVIENQEPVHRSESSLGDDSEYDVIITNTKDGLEKFYSNIRFHMEKRV